MLLLLITNCSYDQEISPHQCFQFVHHVQINDAEAEKPVVMNDDVTTKEEDEAVGLNDFSGAMILATSSDRRKTPVVSVTILNDDPVYQL